MVSLKHLLELLGALSSSLVSLTGLGSEAREGDCHSEGK